MTEVIGALAVLVLAVLIVWVVNRPDRDRLPITRERRRMWIAHERDDRS